MKWSKNCQSFCLDSEVFSGSAYDHACGGGTDVADCGGVTDRHWGAGAVKLAWSCQYRRVERGTRHVCHCVSTAQCALALWRDCAPLRAARFKGTGIEFCV